jgi:hypothetical protein
MRGSKTIGLTTAFLLNGSGIAVASIPPPKLMLRHHYLRALACYHRDNSAKLNRLELEGNRFDSYASCLSCHQRIRQYPSRNSCHSVSSLICFPPMGLLLLPSRAHLAPIIQPFISCQLWKCRDKDWKRNIILQNKHVNSCQFDVVELVDIDCHLVFVLVPQ